MALLIKAITMFIDEDSNATKNIKFLQSIYNLNSFGHKSIYDLYSMIRKLIAHYYNNVYKTEKLTYDDQMKNIAVDESLFVTDVIGIKYWVIGLIDVHSEI